MLLPREGRIQLCGGCLLPIGLRLKATTSSNREKNGAGRAQCYTATDDDMLCYGENMTKRVIWVHAQNKDDAKFSLLIFQNEGFYIYVLHLPHRPEGLQTNRRTRTKL